MAGSANMTLSTMEFIINTRNMNSTTKLTANVSPNNRHTNMGKLIGMGIGAMVGGVLFLIFCIYISCLWLHRGGREVSAETRMRVLRERRDFENYP
jgi:hypothetical protein